MKEPGVDLGQGHAASGRTIDSQQHFIPAHRWRSTRAKGRRNKAVGIAHASERDGESYGRGVRRPGPGKHRRAVKRKSTNALKRKSGAIEQVDRQVIGPTGLRIIPQRDLRVIAYPSGMRRLNLQSIEKPATADGVASLGNSDALPEWSRSREPARKRKVAD